METNLSASIKTSTQNKPEEGFSSALLHNLLETDKPPWGALVFEQDGSVSSLCADGEIIGEENAKHIMIALDFAHYAFDRPDWMMEFIKHVFPKFVRPHLPGISVGRPGVGEGVSEFLIGEVDIALSLRPPLCRYE